MITYQASTKTFWLEGKNVTYAFFINSLGYAEHLYFGAKIERDVLFYTRMAGPGTAGATPLGQDVQGQMPISSYQFCPPELSFYGTGDYREPAVLAQTAAGDRMTDLLYVGHDILPEKPAITGMPSLSGGETLVLHLADAYNGFAADLHYTVYDDADVIARRVVYKNGGEDPIVLRRAYSFSFGLPENRYDVLSLWGTWAGERRVDRSPMRHGVTEVSSKRVSSSASQNPFLAVMDRGTDENHGEVWGFSLVYSSSWVLKVQGIPNGSTVVTGGIGDFDFSWKLGVGESFETPEIVIAYSREGLGGMSRAYHDVYRDHLIHPNYVYTHRPVLINNWEGTYFRFDTDKLKAIVDAVEGTGIDTFVLDDGWFGVRDNDRSGLGDWVVNERKLSGGLSAIIDYVHAKDMKFGLWFEPEMVNEDSDLYRAHPDYVIGIPERGHCYSRHQFMLDLTREDVRAHIADSVNAILHAYPIDYVKWDFNRNATENWSLGREPERQAEFAHRYALGLYDLCDRIVLANPGVFFEGCASGGARFDPAMLRYFPQIWTSDNSDAEDRTFIQYGTSLVYPLSAMSCHVSVCPNHQTGRTAPFATRADIAHLGATGYELDTTAFTDEDREAVKRQIADYHKMEDLVLLGDLYRVGSPDDNVFAAVVVSKNKSSAIATAYRRLGGPSHEIWRLRVPGLDPAKHYFVPELGIILSGFTLAQVGIAANAFPKGDFTTWVLHFEEK